MACNLFSDQQQGPERHLDCFPLLEKMGSRVISQMDEATS